MIPMLDLQRQYATIKRETQAAINQVCDSQKFILGDTVADFESDFRHWNQSNHAVGVSSGTDALVLSLLAARVGVGDEVITTPFTFFATAGAIARVGATPVFVDIDADTFNIDATKIADKVTPKTKAVIPVHLFGQCADMHGVSRSVPSHIAIIEDACQSVGAICGELMAGTMGDFGCFSFFPSKNLGGFGDGGMVTTWGDGDADNLRKLRVHGATGLYEHDSIGGNFRLDALQAAVLGVKLKHLRNWTDLRAMNADIYYREFKDAQDCGLLTCPVVADYTTRHVWNQYTLRIHNGKRDLVASELKKRGIGCAVYYPKPLHLQDCFRYLGYRAGDLPIAEKASREVLSIPIFPELTELELDAVVTAIYDILK